MKGIKMIFQDIELVKQLIKDNPQDDFWIDGNNEILFDEIVDMVNRGGYDLKLIKK
jgi:hypothetical protein